MDLGPYLGPSNPMPHLQHTHTHRHIQNARMRASGIRKTDIPIFLYLFLDFLMYFDISGFVFAKKITCAINRQTVVVTSLKMASLDHSEPTRPPQVDISNLVTTDDMLSSFLKSKNPQIGTVSLEITFSLNVKIYKVTLNQNT